MKNKKTIITVLIYILVLSTMCFLVFHGNKTDDFIPENVDVKGSFIGYDEEYYKSNYLLIKNSHPNEKPYAYQISVTNNNKSKIENVCINVTSNGKTTVSPFLDEYFVVLPGSQEKSELLYYYSKSNSNNDTYKELVETLKIQISYEVDEEIYYSDVEWE